MSPEIIAEIVSLTKCCVREAKNIFGMVLSCSSEEEQRAVLNNIKISPVIGQNSAIGRQSGASGKGSLSFDTSWSMLQAIERTVYTSTELLCKQFEPITHFVRPFLTDAALVMIFAEAGSGKTWLVLSVAAALTNLKKKAMPIGPWVVESCCRVLFVDGEMRSRDIKSRLSEILGPLNSQCSETPLEIVSNDEIFQREKKRINLMLQSCRDALSIYLERNPTIKVLILDNLSSLCPGISENTKSDWDPINLWLLQLRSSGVAVIVIHHANKSGDYRGSSGRIDNLDTVIKLKRLGLADELHFRVDYQKTRGYLKGEGKSFIIKGVHRPEDGCLVWEHADCDNENADSINEKDRLITMHILLKKKSQAEIAKECGVSQATVSNRRRDAIADGLMHASGGITDNGVAYLRKYFPDLEGTLEGKELSSLAA